MTTAVLPWRTLAHETEPFEPWWAQRLAARSRAPIRTIVAGRQTGKSMIASRIVVKTMCTRPRSVSCLLMPTKKGTTMPLKHLRTALESALGPEGGRWVWRSQDAMFRLWNGAELYVRTCDNEATEGVPTRGLQVDGILWVDEAAYVPLSAWEAARLTQVAVRSPLTLVTSTPCGKNWVYDEFQAGVPGPNKSPQNESFRFRSTQSPFANAEFIEDTKRKMGAKKAMQELDAVFLGDGGSVFTREEVDAFLGPHRPLVLARRGARISLGIDLGKERDFIALTSMNEFAEAWLEWRARGVPWPEAKDRIASIARDLDAFCVVDLAKGGGYGGMMRDFLVAELGPERVLGVQTGNKGVKAQMVESLQSEAQAGVLRFAVDEDVHDIARREFLFYEGHRQIIGGVEVWSYHGPRSEKKGKTADGADEDHDDIVDSLGLANWGRLHGFEDEDEGDGGIASFKPRGGPSTPPAAMPASRMDRGARRQVDSQGRPRSGGYFYR